MSWTTRLNRTLWQVYPFAGFLDKKYLNPNRRASRAEKYTQTSVAIPQKKRVLKPNPFRRGSNPVDVFRSFSKNAE
jgi:hypothetical protein